MAWLEERAGVHTRRDGALPYAEVKRLTVGSERFRAGMAQRGW